MSSPFGINKGGARNVWKEAEAPSFPSRIAENAANEKDKAASRARLDAAIAHKTSHARRDHDSRIVERALKLLRAIVADSSDAAALAEEIGEIARRSGAADPD